MNNAELADRIAASQEMSKAQARRVLDTVLTTIVDAAKSGDEVALSGFGRFKITERSGRQGHNPQTGETIQIAASRKLAFAPAKPLRDAVNPSTDKAATPGGKAKAPTKSKAAAAASPAPAKSKKAG